MEVSSAELESSDSSELECSELDAFSAPDASGIEMSESESLESVSVSVSVSADSASLDGVEWSLQILTARRLSSGLLLAMMGPLLAIACRSGWFIVDQNR